MDISVQTVFQRGWRDMVLSTVPLFLPLFLFSALRSHKKHHSSFSSDGSQQFLKSFTETPKHWCNFLFNRREEPAGEGKPFCSFERLRRKPSPGYCYYLPTWQAVRPADLFWWKLQLLENFTEKNCNPTVWERDSWNKTHKRSANKKANSNACHLVLEINC